MENMITPHSSICMPEKVKYKEGDVTHEENILAHNEDSAVITYPQNGPKPFLCLDFGPASPGGYPVFEIEGFSGEPILRVSYADWYDYICDPNYRENGDFQRGTCKYLGPELPVLPANPNRYELYHICRTGSYLYPLIQGQQRFVLLSLDTPGTSVKISRFYIHYTSSLEKYPGGFRSSMPELDYLWDASIYTLQLATLSNSQSFDILNNQLLVRTLTKGNDAGFFKPGTSWDNYIFTIFAELPCQPDCVNSFGWMIRAGDADHAYVFRLTLSGQLSFSLRKNGINREIFPRIDLHIPLQANRIYKITTRVVENHFYVSVNDGEEFAFGDDTYLRGSVGFCQTPETWAVVRSYTVTDLNGQALYEEKFDRGLSEYEFCSSPEFISDGAKRDRLPWMGDLYWAGENVHYSFGDFLPMRNTLELFRLHQCPDGFVWGVCYPENTTPPSKNDYGMYQSDIFSSWYVITTAYEYLFHGDPDFLNHCYPSVARELDYMWNHIDGSNMFYQRYETSKGLWDHYLNDYGYYSYNNLIAVKAFRDGAFLADALGCTEEAQAFEARADTVFSKVLALLWDEETGTFHKSLKDHSPCYLATSFAFAFGLIPKDSAEKTLRTMCALHDDEFQSGKTVSLFLKGCFKYGFAEPAFRILTGSTGKLDYLGSCTLNWIDAVRDPKGPACTAECMPYSHIRVANGACWNDSSHPDTGVAFLMSAYILGIRPTAPGFTEFRFSPSLCGLTHVEGTVPTPYGNITASLHVEENGTLTADLYYPPETHPEVLIEAQYRDTAAIHLHPAFE